MLRPKFGTSTIIACVATLTFACADASAAVLDGVEKAFVICGYSTSAQWPDMLQAKLDRLTDGERVYHIRNAWVPGSPVARWIDIETDRPKRPYTDMLEEFFGESSPTPQPTVALCQQSLQFLQRPDGETPMAGPVSGPDDAVGRAFGADAFGALAEMLHLDGCSTVFIAAHIYKKPREPQIGSERHALADLLARDVPYLAAGPDVWEPTEAGYPDLFAEDLLHPNMLGAAVMAQLWFEALLRHDELAVPDWSRAELEAELGAELWERIAPTLPELQPEDAE